MGKRYTEEELNKIDEAFRELLAEKPYVFLLVDPSVAWRKTLAKAMSQAGCETVLEAKDAAEAFPILRKNRGTVVAVVDINLPQKDAIQFLREIRREEDLKKTIVLVTGEEKRKERILAAIQAGANAYLHRPFSPETLVKKLASMRLL